MANKPQTLKNEYLCAHAIKINDLNKNYIIYYGSTMWNRRFA